MIEESSTPAISSSEDAFSRKFLSPTKSGSADVAVSNARGHANEVGHEKAGPKIDSISCWDNALNSNYDCLTTGQESHNSAWETRDCIAALSTASGRGAIGIVRMSGPGVFSIISSCFRPAGGKPLSFETNRLTYGHIVEPVNGEAIDEVLLSIMRAPRTYTREDIVEVNCHGGPLVQRAILRLLIQMGARLAEPGEFTKRAFLNGRIDLTQAESVASIVAARSSGALRASLRQLAGGLSERLCAIRQELVVQLAIIEATVDFSDEDVDELNWDELAANLLAILHNITRLLSTAFLGKALEQGVNTAIIGQPNVGKSSLLNALLQRDRAIVSDEPGTTRDTIEEMMEIAGIPIHLIDTAGVREGGAQIEKLGVQRSLHALDHADLVLAVFDISSPFMKFDADIVKRLNPERSIIIGNKADLVNQENATVQTSAYICAKENNLSDDFGDAPCKCADCMDERQQKDIKTFASYSKGEQCGKITGFAGHLQENRWLYCEVSALTGEGLDRLKELIEQVVAGKEGIDPGEPVLTTERQRCLVEEAEKHVSTAYESARKHISEELVCEDIRSAINCLGRLTGEDLTSDLLDEIFSRFCLGK